MELIGVRGPWTAAGIALVAAGALEVVRAVLRRREAAVPTGV
jgi:hypothetical protein